MACLAWGAGRDFEAAWSITLGGGHADGAEESEEDSRKTHFEDVFG